MNQQKNCENHFKQQKSSNQQERCDSDHADARQIYCKVKFIKWNQPLLKYTKGALSPGEQLTMGKVTHSQIFIRKILEKFTFQ